MLGIDASTILIFLIVVTIHPLYKLTDISKTKFISRVLGYVIITGVIITGMSLANYNFEYPKTNEELSRVVTSEMYKTTESKISMHYTYRTNNATESEKVIEHVIDKFGYRVVILDTFESNSPILRFMSSQTVTTKLIIEKEENK